MHDQHTHDSRISPTDADEMPYEQQRGGAEKSPTYDSLLMAKKTRLSRN